MANKIAICEEEADETLFWLELIVEARLMKEKVLKPLMDEVDQIVAMLVASLKTLRGKSNLKSKI